MSNLRFFSNPLKTLLHEPRNVWKIHGSKVIMQGKLFQRCTHLLYCSVLSLGGNVNTRRMSQPDMGFIFHVKNQWNILVIGNYYVNDQIIKIKCFYPPWILNKHWCIYFCLQIPPRENWFQYVRTDAEHTQQQLTFLALLPWWELTKLILWLADTVCFWRISCVLSCLEYFNIFEYFL